MKNKKEYSVIMDLLLEINHDLKEMVNFYENNEDNNQFLRRLIFRNIFSSIEGCIHSYRELLKIKINNDYECFSIEKRYILNQKDITINKKGEIISYDRYYNFESNFRFIHNCIAEVFELELIGFSDSSFRDLILMAKRRNDITHPKTSDNLIITDKDFKTLWKGFIWFLNYNVVILDELHKQLNDYER